LTAPTSDIAVIRSDVLHIAYDGRQYDHCDEGETNEKIQHLLCPSQERRGNASRGMPVSLDNFYTVPPRQIARNDA
jgi:hypothetical protein